MPPAKFHLRASSASQNISDLDFSQHQVMDETADGFARKVPRNEVLVLSLNERAVLGGRGFFLHLPSRESLTTPPDVERLPASRAPEKPSALYPSLIYMDFVWSAKGSAAFFSDTHRARYLKSSAIMNPPHDSTPLYALQHVSSERGLLYATAVDSMVILDGPTGHRFVTTSRADAIAGRYTGRFGRTDPDLALRIHTSRFKGIWKPLEADSAASHLAELPILDAESLYRSIRQFVSSGQIRSTFTAGELRNILPRPAAPELGAMLGSKIQRGVDDEEEEADIGQPQAGPPSKRLVTRRRAEMG